MHINFIHRFILGLALILVAFVTPQSVSAESTYLGPKKCQECHKAEYQIWEGTAHFKSFRTLHKKKEAKAIAKAIGDKSAKRSETCKMCHYTSAKKKPTAKKAKLVAGPSCESCHGPASAWLDIHNNYGGPNVKREAETAEHKAMRREKSRKAGLIWPDEKHRVAKNCNACHAMAHEGLDGAKIDKMIEAGHPINPEFELVRYSQGSVRHRFYPPDMSKNQVMTPALLAETFVLGQAVALVSTTSAMKKTKNEKYSAALKKRNDAAKAALAAIKGDVPEAEALLSDPTDANASALAAAVIGKDFSAQVGGMLPAKDTYK